MDFKLRGNFSKNKETALYEILMNRGVTDLESFITPTQEKCDVCAYLLDNIEDGAKMLLKHLEAESKICIIVDSDADGYTSSSILWNYIKKVYPNANLSFTVHEGKQHGLEDKIDWLVYNCDYNLVICPDSASFDTEYQERLNRIGVDCLVIDHHEAPEDFSIIDIPSNTIVINNQLSEKYTNKTLCGAGMVYKFCQVLDEILQVSFAEEFIDLVALGEISDVMSKTSIETNYLIERGLQQIKNKGFQTLLESQSYSLKEKALFPYYGLTSIDVAFYISPLINAITRMGTIDEKETMFYCFTDPMRKRQSTKRGAKQGEIEYAAEQTARVAKNVKSRQDRIKEKAIDLIDMKIKKENLLDNNILVIQMKLSDEIPSELTGLIAGACVSKYQRPCLILRKNEEGFLRGSGRNNERFKELPDLKAFLESSGYFEYCMGHANAHGSSIHESKLDAFIKYSNEYFTEDAFKNCYIVDYVLDANEFGLDGFLGSLANHPEYFGNGIEEIEVIINNVPISSFFVMGKNKDCVKLQYNNVEYVRFKDENFIEELSFLDKEKTMINICGKLYLNEWNGKKSVQCNISDYEIVESSQSKYDF